MSQSEAATQLHAAMAFFQVPRDGLCVVVSLVCFHSVEATLTTRLQTIDIKDKNIVS